MDIIDMYYHLMMYIMMENIDICYHMGISGFFVVVFASQLFSLNGRKYFVLPFPAGATTTLSN